MIVRILFVIIDATTGVARVQVLDVNDELPVFILSSLFTGVEEDVPFGVSVAQLEVSNYKCLLIAIGELSVTLLIIMTLYFQHAGN